MPAQIIIPTLCCVSIYVYKTQKEKYLSFYIGRNNTYFKKLFNLKINIAYQLTTIVFLAIVLVALTFFLLNPDSTFSTQTSSINLSKYRSFIEQFIYRNHIYIFWFECLTCIIIPVFVFTILAQYFYELFNNFIITLLGIYFYFLVIPYLLFSFIPFSFLPTTALYIEGIENFTLYKILYPYTSVLLLLIILGVKKYDL